MEDTQTTSDKLKPTPGKITLAGVMMVLGFLMVLTYHELASPFSLKALLFLALVAVLGAVVMMAGLSGLSVLYTLPLLILTLKSPLAVGIFLFAIIGTTTSRAKFSNQIKPRLGSALKEVFGLPYLLLVILLVVLLFPRMNLTIPRTLEEMVVDLGSPLVESALGCPLEMTGDACLTYMATEEIRQYCGGDQTCIDRTLATELVARTTILKTQMESLLPDFDMQRSLKSQVVDWMDSFVNQMISGIQPIIRGVMAAGLFFGLHFLGNWVLLPVAAVVARLLLLIFGVTGLVEKTTVQTDQTVFKV
ncbi:MAG TPA: hypothetical protein ENN60_02355 [archaeon]|nr:hypothetical protein [archaeon]